MASYLSTVLADSPVSYWRLDDTGSTAADQQGVNPGAIGTLPTRGVPGAINDGDTAIMFAGGTAAQCYIGVPDGVSLNPVAFSVENWLSPTDIASGTHISVGKSTATPTQNGWNLRTTATGQIQWAMMSAGTVTNTSTPAGTISLNVWYHVVCTFDGAGGTFVYVNGVQAASGSAIAFTAAAVELAIGADRVGLNAYHGSIDEVAFYNAVLTPVQIQTHFAANPPNQSFSPDRMPIGA